MKIDRMLEKPDLSDDKICACLQAAYGFNPARIEFLPLGNDASAWVYRVDTQAGAQYFLKVKQGGVYLPGLSVARWLQDQGIQEVVAPLPARDGALYQTLEEYSLVLYPFIAGPTGMQAGLTDAQWVAFGQVLRRIHAARLAEDLLAQMRRETFAPPWAEMVGTLQARITQGGWQQPVERALADFWQSKAEEITRLVAHTIALGQRLREKPLDFVLCHTDIHTANILLDAQGGLHIVDWDQPLLAPVERDLMFVPESGRETQLFFRGYGLTRMDHLALAYYHYEWVVQEIGDFGQRVLAMPELGQASKQAALQGFLHLWQPGDVVEQANRSG